jgi:hypothetical protein
MTGDVTRVFPVFAAAFALIYVIVEQQNWPLFTYHARTAEFGWLRQTAIAPNNPAMHWFGWIATSLIGATVVSLAALPMTRGKEPAVWIGWVVPLVVMIIFVYLFRSFFMPR